MNISINYFKAASILIAANILMASCSNVDETSEPIQNKWVQIELDDNTRAASESLKNFYMSFTTDAVKYADSQTGDESRNVIVSPLSASMVLAMVANGVDSEIQTTITDYIGTSDIEALNKLASVLLTELPKADNRSELKLSNSAWINENYKFSKEYTNLLEASYLAEFGNFNSKNVVSKINNWCSNHTNGLIKDMFTDINPATVAILLNALYFRGLWQDETEFIPDNTKQDNFKGLNGDSSVDMMHSLHKDKIYYSDENFESFCLFFGNSSFTLWIILPSANLDTEEANNLLADENLEKFIKEGVWVSLEVFLPKFDVKYNASLNDIFATAGLDKLNNEQRLNMLDPAIDGIIEYTQSSSMGINEEGVKAATVTSGLVSTLAPEAGQSYTVKVDRPFYFFLRDKSTGACLLSGRIADL